MLEFEVKLERDAEGRVVGIACKIGDGAAARIGESVDLAMQIERFLGVALSEGQAIEGRNPAGKLFESYRSWAAQAGMTGLPIGRFAQAMRAAGFAQISSNGRKWFIPSGTAKRLIPRAPGAGSDPKPSGVERVTSGAKAGVRGEPGLFEGLEKAGSGKSARRAKSKA